MNSIYTGLRQYNPSKEVVLAAEESNTLGKDYATETV